MDRAVRVGDRFDGGRVELIGRNLLVIRSDPAFDKTGVRSFLVSKPRLR
jgi:hypothetical protein